MERLEIIEALKHVPDRVEAAVAGLSDAARRFRSDEGEWSINEVVGHMRDAAEVWQTRLYMVWSQTDPALVSFDGEASVRDRAYQDADLSDVIAALRRYRLQMVDLLSGAVDWTRLGQQPGVGRRSLKQLAEFVLAHDENHLAQIQALKQTQG